MSNNVINDHEKKSNLLIDRYPNLIASEWDYKKNNAIGLKPDEVLKGSHRKAWWHCKQYGHSYESQICNRTNGYGCPFCAGKKVLAGFNDLQSKYTELIESEWDWGKNNAKKLYPNEITKSCRKKAWWHCKSFPHSYEMTVNDKTSGLGCPYCSGKRVLAGFNDLQTLYPKLIENEWDWNKNNMKPSMFTKGSTVKAWWHCDTCNGAYQMMIANKIKGQGCPYCSCRKVLTGFNDLQSCYPELVESEWDYEKNNRNGLHPDSIMKSSRRKAWWKCKSYGHSWYALINNRTILGRGCPKCAHRISKQEDEVASFINAFLSKHYANMNYTMKRSIKFKRIYEMLGIHTDVLSTCLQAHLLKELDIYIPELGFAVEYDGDYWHNDEMMLRNKGMTNEEAHRIKQELCLHAEIELLFISEHDWLNDNEKVKRLLIKGLTIH